MDELGVRTHFLRVLDLSPGATKEDILLAWTRKLKECSDDAEAQQINQAYSMLVDASLLRKYMVMLSQARQSVEPSQLSEEAQQSDCAQELEDPVQAEIFDQSFDALAELYHVAMTAASLAAKHNRCDPPMSLDDFQAAVYAGSVAAAKKMAEIIIKEIKQANGGTIDRTLVSDLFSEATKLGAQAAFEERRKYEAELKQRRPEPFSVALKRWWLNLGANQAESKPFERRYVRPDYFHMMTEIYDEQEK